MLTIYPREGSAQPSGVTPQGPGLILMGGGGDIDAAFVWMHDVIAGSKEGNGGDIIVLRASGDYAYDPYLMKLARFNSVRTIKVDPKASAADLATVAGYVRQAQGVFFAGGDQANYVWWKGSPLAAAVQQVYESGGVVGGNSAGLAIQGEWIYDSVAADRAGADVEVTTKNAVPDPAEPIISFTHDLLRWPPLRGFITDTHFVQRDRLGRLAAFLARLHQEGAGDVIGLGIDTGTAILVDKHGIGTLIRNNPHGAALFLRGGVAQPIQQGTPLVYKGITVTLLDQDGQTYDFNKRCAQA
ncbi:MAG: cyanophycinase, partial [Candidatus Eremiobacteraeota bacterium]|nr:cyanophycinase [Candidatus Eremiobacteraeota bacterium]